MLPLGSVVAPRHSPSACSEMTKKKCDVDDLVLVDSEPPLHAHVHTHVYTHVYAHVYAHVHSIAPIDTEPHLRLQTYNYAYTRAFGRVVRTRWKALAEAVVMTY